MAISWATWSRTSSKVRRPDLPFLGTSALWSITEAALVVLLDRRDLSEPPSEWDVRMPIMTTVNMWGPYWACHRLEEHMTGRFIKDLSLFLVQNHRVDSTRNVRDEMIEWDMRTGSVYTARASFCSCSPRPPFQSRRRFHGDLAWKDVTLTRN